MARLFGGTARIQDHLFRGDTRRFVINLIKMSDLRICMYLIFRSHHEISTITRY